MNNLPVVTKNLLIINVLMFLADLVAQSYGIDLDQYLGLHFVLSDHFNAAQLITYMFMHGGFSHIFFNMFAVWMFGRLLEQVWGPRKFLFYYMVCGIGAALVQEGVTAIRFFSIESGMSAAEIQTVMDEGSKIWSQGMNYTLPAMSSLNALLNVATVGASGSIFGLLLGFAMLAPNSPMLVFPIPFPIKAKYFVAGYALIELWAGMANNPYDNVAHFAHLGGALFGFLIILYWRKKNRQRNDFYFQ